MADLQGFQGKWRRKLLIAISKFYFLHDDIDKVHAHAQLHLPHQTL
jgi:hypothetical protein